jgi:hypothetical protein
MTGRPLPLSTFLLALAGPIIWFAHFVGLYLAEAFLCSFSGPGAAVHLRVIGAIWTVLALATLLALVAWGRRGDGMIAPDTRLTFDRPLTALSILAVLWTSGPLLALPACAPGG